ncbi:MAG: hypothetical protein ABWU84_12575 [Pyrobaculum sp.]
MARMLEDDAACPSADAPASAVASRGSPHLAHSIWHVWPQAGSVKQHVAYR